MGKPACYKTWVNYSNAETKIFYLPGAAVVQVRARDKDAEEDPNSPAGQIEFSIVSTHKKFKIDAETGWLSTNTVS